MKLKMLVASFALVGCGGSSFTVGFGENEADGGAVVSSGGEVGSGGSEASGGTSSGGALGSGGSSGSAGNGAVDAGGRRAMGGSLGLGGASGSTGGAVDADGGHGSTCTLVTHDNGAGQTWDDCEPLGTYNKDQAMKACKASGAATCVSSTRCGPAVLEVQGFDADGYLVAEWGYGDFAAGLVSLDYNLCSPGDPGRRQWR